MAVNVKIVVNRGAVGELLRDPDFTGLERRAQAIASAAGPGHEVEVFIGRNRARATVRTATDEARHNEAVSRTLTSAIDAGR